MIFEFTTYRELINFILSHYPYEKIITYCDDLGYRWTYMNETKKLTKTDISKHLLYALSDFVSRRYIEKGRDVIIPDDDKKIIEICQNYHKYSKYFRVRGRDNSLVITFRFEYTGRFRKYSIVREPKYGNPRTKVVFRFR